ncbi:hypothetical protein [Nocardioides daejeonensis]|uniref:hypothetical protein n=1 Tax=Nocardioides daejeonensis TaxID=1046556 RepID=UPI000D74989D|nr:hypothetical protein [Nocardioides daejeonensis]
MPNEMEQLNVVQDAELLYESIRAMKQISADATSPVTLRALLGHLNVAGHLLPEVLDELSESLDASVDPEKYPELTPERLAQCQAHIQEAADLAFRAGTLFGLAKKVLDAEGDASADTGD